MPRWIETDSLADHDVHGTHLLGSYTCDADRLILAQVLCDTVDGTGDYSFYACLQLAGAGSAYQFLPVTTDTIGAITAIGAQSGLIAMRDDDVLTVYGIFPAGDDNVDVACRFFELATLQAVTPANRVVVVDAAGLVDANAVKVGPTGTGTAQTARDLGLAVPAAAPGGAGGLPLTDAQGVKLSATQGPVSFAGQVKVTANVPAEGALQIENTNAYGIGAYNTAPFIGQMNGSAGTGQQNLGGVGLQNIGVITGMSSEGPIPVSPAPALASDMTTLLARIGAWTGTGLNTVLGAFRALAGKASALTPTDLSSGTTFDNTTDSQEAIRDAMALEATLTAIKGAGWSTETLKAIDTLLDAIKLKTDTIGAGTVTAVSPVTTVGDVEIDQGYDYYAVDGRGLSWTDDTPATWPNLTGATATFRCGILAVTGTITTPTGPATLSFDLTRVQTATLAVGVHPFKVDCTLANGHLVLELRGSVHVS